MTATLPANGERELIERLEKATGPDRDLDLDITLACLPNGENGRARLPILAEDVGNHCYEWVEISGVSIRSAPHYTSSIDAALTLVPEGKYWDLSRGLPAQTIRHIYWAEVYGDDNAHDSQHPICPGANPAIALCIAALRARNGAAS